MSALTGSNSSSLLCAWNGRQPYPLYPDEKTDSMEVKYSSLENATHVNFMACSDVDFYNISEGS